MDRAEKKAAITGENITTLTTILNQAGIILENFRIFSALEEANAGLQNANKQLKIVNNDLRVAQSRIRKDLEHARSIQQGLLPQNIERSDFLSAAATYIPAEAVGGDYYDVFEISASKYGIVVADVSLIMSMVKVLLKTFASKESGPQETLETINETFLTEIQTDNFVTIFYAVLDTESHTMCYNSAGHCPMIFINKETGKSDLIKADGLFLGVFPDMMLEQTCMNYDPGKLRLVLYTDGLTEAKNARDEMFELVRLEEVALASINATPDACLKRILSTQREFCGTKEEPEDDITLLVIDL
jgi:sigma-B regulation protein RsbU (phosphoserine phosphatase)